MAPTPSLHTSYRHIIDRYTHDDSPGTPYASRLSINKSSLEYQSSALQSHWTRALRCMQTLLCTYLWRQQVLYVTHSMTIPVTHLSGCLQIRSRKTCISAYQSFQVRVDSMGYEIKRFRCDNGRGEYDNKTFRSVLTARGTTYEPCPPYAHHKKERWPKWLPSTIRNSIQDASRIPFSTTLLRGGLSSIASAFCKWQDYKRRPIDTLSSAHTTPRCTFL